MKTGRTHDPILAPAIAVSIALCVFTVVTVAPRLDAVGVKVADAATPLRVIYVLALCALGSTLSPAVVSGLHRSVRLAATRSIGRRGVAAALGALVGASGAIWHALTTGATLPRILGDELLYMKLGHSLAAGDGLVVRAIETPGYGIGYPLFVALFALVAPDGVDAYHWLQAAQHLLMASAAFPAYLLARRVLGRLAAFTAAALSAWVPQMLIASLVMTESLFYPCVLWFALSAARALEHPSLIRQLVALIAIAAATLVRLQGVILIAALATAVFVHFGSSRRKPSSTAVRRWIPTLGLIAVIGAAVAVGAALGRGPIGAYSILVDRPDPVDTLAWSARTIGVLALAVGIVGAALFIPGLRTLLRGSNSDRAVAAVTLSTTAWVVAIVGHFSSTEYGFEHVHERNVFTVVPLILIPALVVAERRAALQTWTRLAGAALVVGSVSSLRQRDLLAQYDVDALTLVPWRSLDGPVLPTNHLVLIAAIAGVAIALRKPRPWAVAIAAAATMAAAVLPPGGMPLRAATDSLSWVDHAVGADADVLVITVNAECEWRPLDELVTWTEFFNRSVRRTAFIVEHNRTANLRDWETRLRIREDGELRSAGGSVRAEFVVIDSRVRIAGRQLAHLRADTLGSYPSSSNALTLWETGPALRITNPRSVVSRPCAE